MPSGIILSSGSQGATKEDVEAVLRKNGYDVEPPETETEKEEEPKEAAQPNKEQEEQHLSRRKRKALEAEQLRKDLDAARRRIDELERGGKAKVEDPEPEPQGAPKREDFASDEDFEEAKFDYRYEQRRKKEQEEEAEQSQFKSAEAAYTKYQERVADFKEEHEDWDELLAKGSANGDLPIRRTTELAIHRQENGPEVVYYLAKNPDYTKKLYAMDELDAIMEIKALSERLKPKSAKREADAERPSTRKIPDPVEPVSTAATTSTNTSREAAAKRDFKAFKKAQRAGR